MQAGHTREGCGLHAAQGAAASITAGKREKGGGHA